MQLSDYILKSIFNLVVFSNITQWKWTELQYFRHTKPPNSFYSAQIGFTVVISRFSSKSFKYFPNPCDPTISPTFFYPTQKCILKPLIFPNDLTIKSTYQNLIFSPIQSRDMMIRHLLKLIVDEIAKLMIEFVFVNIGKPSPAVAPLG